MSTDKLKACARLAHSRGLEVTPDEVVEWANYIAELSSQLPEDWVDGYLNGERPATVSLHYYFANARREPSRTR